MTESQNWLTQIKNAKKTCINQNKISKVHYLFENNNEMVEEYNLETDVLLRRAWKIKSELGAEGSWEVEIGDPEPNIKNPEYLTIAESVNEPIISRRLTKRSLEWRIRNLPYPIETYSVKADPDNKRIIVSTTNKKYYKKLTIPELERIGIHPEQSSIEYTHKFNTLIITYKKPKNLIDLENSVLEEVKKLKPAHEDNCKTS